MLCPSCPTSTAAPLIKRNLGLLGLALLAFLTVRAAENSSETIQLEPFRVKAYTGKIPIIDGYTGKRYDGTHPTVTQFAESFNKILLGYHKKLVLDEVQHIRIRIQLAKEFEEEMRKLTTPFGFKPFVLNPSTWLSREKAIISRLIKKPFFKIKALVVWDLDELDRIAPQKPANRYANDIRFNTETGKWERRVTTRWEVAYERIEGGNFKYFQTEKIQGLNLDTQNGFHYIEVGLPPDVTPDAFEDVSLTYPVFYSSNHTREADLTYLKETFVKNLQSIYDPFSWVARRDTRFRGGFIRECTHYIGEQPIYVVDRDWFNPVLAQFFSDVVTIRQQGAEEIYSLHMLNKRRGETPRVLGAGLDLLNWNAGEDRQSKDLPEREPQLSVGNPVGFRYVMIDAYQRFGNLLVDKIKTRIVALTEKSPPTKGRDILIAIIEELSGMPYPDFAKRAKATQEKNLALFKLSSIQKPAAVATQRLEMEEENPAASKP